MLFDFAVLPYCDKCNNDGDDGCLPARRRKLNLALPRAALPHNGASASPQCVACAICAMSAIEGKEDIQWSAQKGHD
jgi:hypothetical protein